MMHYKDMKAISAFDTHGKVITKVFDADRGWQEYASKSKIPRSGFLMNYDLRFGNRTILLLDNYGNDFMPTEVEVGAPYREGLPTTVAPRHRSSDGRDSPIRVLHGEGEAHRRFLPIRVEPKSAEEVPQAPGQPQELQATMGLLVEAFLLARPLGPEHVLGRLHLDHGNPAGAVPEPKEVPGDLGRQFQSCV